MYELTIYTVKTAHYVKVDEVNLNFFRESMRSDTAPKFIEVQCLDAGSMFGIRRKSVEAYNYEWVEE